MKIITNCIFIISFLSIVQFAVSAKILVLYLLGTRSHKNFAVPIYNELAKRGHSVVVISAYKDSKAVSGVKEIIVNTSIDILSGKLMNRNRFEEQDKGLMQLLTIFMSMDEAIEQTEERVFSYPEVQKLIDSNEQFDLVLLNGYFNEFAFGWIHKLQAPVVALSPSGLLPYLLEPMGSPYTMANVDNFFYGKSKYMSFLQRASNVGAMLILTTVRNCWIVPKVDQMIQKRFPGSPNIREIERNFSLIISNTHLSINGPKPFAPTVVEAGGVHCKPAKPLPKDLQDFVDGSGNDGFILFSFGSVVKASEMPEKYRKIFLDVFSRFPQRVLWKWETEKMDDLPSNVKLSKWLPQQDLLGHPKCRAFITHGGLLSTQEAVYHGIPLVGIPFFGDQSMNMNLAAESGYAIKIDLQSLSADQLQESLKRVMTEHSFKAKVNHLSTLLRDQPDSALDRAVFWIEYVVRHNGAPHLKPYAANYHWLQNLQLDVLSFLAFIVVLVVVMLFLMVFLVFKLVFRLLCNRKKSVPKDKKNK